MTRVKSGLAPRRNPLQDASRNLTRALTSRVWLVAVVVGGIVAGSDAARGQDDFFFGGGTRTWSNTLSWWQNYQATLQALSAPGATDTAIFNTSGANAAGVAVFTADASVAGLRVLQTATGGLTLRSVTTDSTLTLGSGGIRVQPGNGSSLTVGSVTAGQGLNVTLGGSQEWRMAGGNVTISNTVSGAAATGSSQTLLIANAAAVTTNVANGAGGGTLNLWLNNSGNVTLTNPSALTGTLTLQSLAAPAGLTPAGLQAVTLPSLSRLQFAGGAIAAASTVNSAGTVEMLGGASTVSLTTGLKAGTYVRSPGGGILGLPGVNANYTATSVPLVNGIIPWAIGGGNESAFVTLTGTTFGTVAGTFVTGNDINNMNSPTNNFNLISRNAWTLTKSNTANSITEIGTGNLATHTLTVNALVYRVSAGIRADPGGALRIGSSGELVLHTQSGAAVEISAPVIESAAGGWLTFGSANIYRGLTNGMVTLSGSNSHSGGTSVLSRRVTLNHAHALGSGTFRIGGNAIVLDTTTAAPLTIATNNRHEWNSDFAFGGTQNLNLGTGTVSLGTWAGSIRTVTVNAGNLTVGGRIEDGTHAELPTTGLAKDGPGTLTLSGANGYTGVTESWGGELRFANRNALYGGGTANWVPANFTTGTLAVISVSVGDQPGAFTAADLDILSGAVGGPVGGYLGIDTTGVTSGTYTYATNIPAPAGDRVLGIAKTGVGTLVLSGNNTFTGGVLAREGTLRVTAAEQVGSGTLVAAGGLLDMNGLTVPNSFLITGGTLANTAIAANKLSAAVTAPALFSGTLTGAGADGNWTKSGTGTLVLSAANTLTGTTTITGGLLSISSDANLNGTASALVFSGGGLQVTGTEVTSLATGRTTTFTAAQSVTFDIADPANTFTVSQNLQQTTGGLTKSGSGTLVASGNNTFTGAVTVTGGTLRMGSATGLRASSSGALTLSGGVLDLSGNSITRSGTVTFAGGGVTGGTVNFTTASIVGQAGTVTANLVGTGGSVGLIKSGTGLLVLSGSVSYPGSTTLNASGGILQFGRTTALYGGTTANWVKTKLFVNSGATLAVNVGGEGEFQAADVTTLLTGISGTINSNGLMAGSSIGFDTTNAGGSFTLADTVANTTGGSSGAVGLQKLGTGTLVLSASSTFTGTTTVGYVGGPNAGTLELAPTGYVSPTVTIRGGTFSTAGQNRSITTLTLGGGAAGSTASLQTGSGTATLGGNVTFSEANNADGATISGNLSLGNAARTFSVGDSIAAGIDLTVSAEISSTGVSGGIVKTGLGTLALTGANSFSAKTQINQGVVQIDSINDSGPSPLGTNTTTDLGSAWQSGTLRWAGATSGTSSRTFALTGTSGGGGTIEAAGTGALVLTGSVTTPDTSAKTFTLAGTSTAPNTIGTISGTGVSVVKDGTGLWRMNAATKGFDGTLTVKQGTLQMANPAAVNDDTIAIGDTAASSIGVAAFLLEQGVSRDAASGIDVLATAGQQAVYLGGANTSGSSTFRGEIRMNRDVTLVAATGGTVDFSSTWAGATTGSPATRNVTIGAAGYAGRALLNNFGALATSGSVAVQYGTAVLGRDTVVSSAGTLAVGSGATLGGAGFVTGAIGGAGLVSPGNSPGILTAGSLDPSGGTGFVFEITGSTPNFLDREASVNDVLRLTDPTAPFASALSAGNVVNVLFNLSGTPVEQGTFKGGFFTDLNTSFFSNISSGSFAYWVTGTYGSAGDQQPFAVGLDGALVTYSRLGAFDPALSVSRSVVPQSANFGAGAVSGQITQFVVVPEPMTLALAGIGSALLAWRVLRRRS